MTQSAIHHYRLLAAAVAARDISIVLQVDADALSYTDGSTIYLATARGLEQQRRELLVQAALIGGGALDKATLRSIVGRPQLTRLHLALEVYRCVMQLQTRLPTSLVQAVFDVIAVDEAVPTAAEVSLLSFRAEHSLALAHSFNDRKFIGTPSFITNIPVWFGEFKPWRVLRNDNAFGTQQIDNDKLAQLESDLTEQPKLQEERDDSESERSTFLEALSNPIGGNSSFSKFMRELLDMQGTPEDAKDGEGVGTESVGARMAARWQQMSHALRVKLPIQLPSSYIEPEPGSHAYAEWDCHKQRYRPRWAVVEEVEPHSSHEHASPPNLGNLNDKALQRSLASLCLNYQRHRHQRQGDDLVLDDLVQLALDIKAGHSGDEAIYSAMLKTRRDLSVMVLLDVSSSTLEFDEQGMRVFDHQSQAAWLITSALARLGDQVALYGFHSWGRTLVHLQRVKTFEEPLSQAAMRRLQQLNACGYSRVGAAIRHASHMVQEASNPHKLLIVISDGYPYDDQYEDEYAVEDTRKALEEAASDSVACICVSVGSDADKDRLERVYGSSNYLSLPKAEALCQRLRPIMETAIAGVARR